MMKDKILEIRIDEKERLTIKPSAQTFTWIYREASEVHWDSVGMFIYSPKPRDWSYFKWFKHMLSVVSNHQSVELVLSNTTKWVNISESLKSEILDFFERKD